MHEYFHLTRPPGLCLEAPITPRNDIAPHHHHHHHHHHPYTLRPQDYLRLLSLRGNQVGDDGALCLLFSAWTKREALADADKLKPAVLLPMDKCDLLTVRANFGLLICSSKVKAGARNNGGGRFRRDSGGSPTEPLAKHFFFHPLRSERTRMIAAERACEMHACARKHARACVWSCAGGRLRSNA